MHQALSPESAVMQVDNRQDQIRGGGGLGLVSQEWSAAAGNGEKASPKPAKSSTPTSA
jgi:hypothetical protein